MARIGNGSIRRWKLIWRRGVAPGGTDGSADGSSQILGHCYQLLAQRDVDLLSSASGEIDASEFLVPVLGSNRIPVENYLLFDRSPAGIGSFVPVRAAQNLPSDGRPGTGWFGIELRRYEFGPLSPGVADGSETERSIDAYIPINYRWVKALHWLRSRVAGRDWNHSIQQRVRLKACSWFSRCSILFIETMPSIPFFVSLVAVFLLASTQHAF
ncbi:hypothetical protein Syun_031970 [Stephania yunnanensis]|uniref:Uncharacterized protein n=1 Tax=Stephania yunnanensis TaxID=152371 RepID=A0AAP0DZG8_9MAGN